MRLRRLHLRAFGPFTNRVLDFGEGQSDLILVRGPNEAGKSSTLRAISDLRFGIPARSSDDFIHKHAMMRIGGEFVARDGTAYSLMRQKGLKSTLHHADFSQTDQGPDRPASAQIEALLTGNLTKEQHDSMFGIDHESLREGGKALLSGNGEIGAALFEASAGILSVPKILYRLDESARKFFMPGARAKSGHINEALSAYEQRQSEFRSAQVRPGAWADLSKALEAADQALATIDRRLRAVHDELRLIGEIRAVSPLLSSLKTAETTLAELAGTPLLSADAASARAAAVQGLADAESNEQRARAEAEEQRALLETLHIEVPILTLSASIRRLSAQVDAMDGLERDKANAEADLRRLETTLSDLHTQIDPAKSNDDTVASAPSKVDRVEMERLLRQAEGATRSLESHRVTKPDVSPEIEQAALPPEEVREHLAAILLDVSRNDGHLRRQEALPLEIETSRREVDRSLDAAGLDEPRFVKLRTLYDTQIDDAINRTRDLETQKTGLDVRIADIDEEIEAVTRRRDLLLLEGSVPTRIEVLTARGLREATWNLVRQAYIDGDAPASTLIEDKQRLPTEYESTVKEADELIDALASDTKRAAEYAACLDSLGLLTRDRGNLAKQVADIAIDVKSHAVSWTDLLASQNLPSLPPAALREWQGRLPAIRAAIEALQQKIAEQNRTTTLCDDLKRRLEGAIVAAGGSFRAHSMLTSLIALAQRSQDNWNRAEKAAVQAAAELKERSVTFKKWEKREEDLVRLDRDARTQVEQVLQRLSLSPSASYEAARVRIQEFDRLVELRAEIAAAQSTVDKSQAALEAITASASQIASHLGEAEVSDTRHFSSQVLERLETATELRNQSRLISQAIESAVKSVSEHSLNARQYVHALTRLCEAASVQNPSQLPEIELLSERKRAALEVVDKTKAQLAAASKRSVDELQQLVAARDINRLDDDEQTLVTERDQLDNEVVVARDRHQLAKAALDKVDASDIAVVAKEAAEQAAAKVRAHMAPWIRSRLAHGLLTESLKRFRERAQGPMLAAASKYFERMTCGNFSSLASEESGEKPVLVALRRSGERVHVDDMSEGTRDQLYLSLRLAALDFRRAAGVDLPIILDDILITSDDERTVAILEALLESAKSHQVMVFTHHNHIVDLARRQLKSGIQVVELA